MRRTLLRLLTAVQLTRLTMAFGAVSDIWLAILLSRAAGRAGTPATELSLTVALAVGAIIAIGLFAFGAALNDLLDVRHDRAFSPERPLAAGRIRVAHAVVVAIGSLLAAIVAATLLGQSALLLTALVASGILFYNAAGKHVPAAGALMVAGLHALHMAIPDARIEFTLPLLLIAAHTFAIAMAVHWLDEKRPPFTTRSLTIAALGFALLAAAIWGVGVVRSDRWLPLPAAISPMELGWPLLAIAGFVCIAWRKTARVPRRVAAEKLRRYGAMWQSLYAVAWLTALGLHGAAIVVGAMAICGFVAMTLIRELTDAGVRPPAYRA